MKKAEKNESFSIYQYNSIDLYGFWAKLIKCPKNQLAEKGWRDL